MLTRDRCEISHDQTDELLSYQTNIFPWGLDFSPTPAMKDKRTSNICCDNSMNWEDKCAYEIYLPQC